VISEDEDALAASVLTFFPPDVAILLMGETSRIVLD
jgi:hypothetical protein